MRRWPSTTLRAWLAAYAMLTAYAVLASAMGLPAPGAGITAPLSLMAFTFAVLHAWLAWGARRALSLLGLTAVLSWAFEAVGVATGWVYGPYHYMGLLGPKLMGVPLLIPIAWFMMSYPSLAIARALWPQGRKAPAAALAGLAAAVMTAWDLVMDPMMVRIGFWAWEVEGAYFGVPIQNCIGWILTTFVFFWLYLRVEPRLPGRASAGLRSGDAGLPALAYLTTWAGNALAAVQLGLSGPALVSLFSAGLLGWLGYLHSRS